VACQVARRKAVANTANTAYLNSLNNQMTALEHQFYLDPTALKTIRALRAQKSTRSRAALSGQPGTITPAQAARAARFGL
jgi:hypothetical protein